MAFHISNRHLEFRGLLANLASTRDQPLVCYACDDLVGAQTAQEVRDGKMASQWVVIARDVSDLGSLRRKGERWHKLAPDPNSAVWTDNYADILGLWKND